VLYNFFVIDAYNKMFDALDMLDEYKLKIRTALDATYAKLRFYYKQTDYSPIYLLSTILSPCYKMNYFTKEKWDKDNIVEIEKLYLFIFVYFFTFNIQRSGSKKSTIGTPVKKLN